MDIAHIAEKFKKVKIAVIGDAMLDVYEKGNGNRICREAPVPIIDVQQTEYHAGGAANTARNAAAMGATTYILTVIGEDEEGNKLITTLEKDNINVKNVVRSTKRKTLAKKRIIASDQILLRFDTGTTKSLEKNSEKKLIRQLEKLYPQLDALIVSDYGYGILTDGIRKKIKELQKKYKKVLSVDSKDVTKYKTLGVTLTKPSYDEVKTLVGTLPNRDRIKFIKKNGHDIKKGLGARIAAITLDRDGALVVSGAKKIIHTSTTPQNDHQAIGAGDTYITAFTLSLAAEAPLKDAARIAQKAAEIVTQKEGTATCTNEDLTQSGHKETKVTPQKKLEKIVEEYKGQGKKIVFTNGCFDILHIGHVKYLEKAAQKGDILIIGLNSDKSVSRLKGPQRPINSQADRAQILAALSFVDHVTIFTQDTPVELIQKLQPDIYVKGGDYTRQTLPETPIVESYGGKIELISFVHDRSTTKIIKKIQSRTRFPKNIYKKNYGIH